MIKQLLNNRVLILGLILLFLLLFKNPFSANSIISNLEPSPDTIHYLSPVKNLIEGKGFVISYQDRILLPAVPPLYSLLLIPFYLLTGDIRSFYFANSLLSFISVILFYKIVTKLFENRVVSILLFFAFVLNLIIFFYPNFAMAENLLMTLFLFSIWLIVNPFSKRNVIFISFLVVAFFATKYVAWILGLSLGLIYILRLLKSGVSPNQKKSYFFLFFLPLFIFFVVYFYLEFLIHGVNFLKEKVTFGISSFSVNKYFSKDNFSDNSIRLLAGIMGGPATIAGGNFIILPITIGMTSLFAIFINLIFPKFRLLSLYFLMTILGTFFYTSTFRVVDSRYILEFIPAFLIIFGIFLENFCRILNKKNRQIYSLALTFISVITITLSVIPPAFYQIKINFFGTDRSANLESIEVMNKYTSSSPSRPIIISVLSPYQIDFFSNKKYDLLPLSNHQYFSDVADKAWGIDPKEDVIDVYKKAISEGKIVYVSDYLTGSKSYYKYDFDRIKENFKLLKVYEGCNKSCNLYKLVVPADNFSSPKKSY